MGTRWCGTWGTPKPPPEFKHSWCQFLKLSRLADEVIGLAVTEQMQGLAFCEAVLAGAGKRSPFWEDDGTHARNTQAWVFLREEPGNARICPKESGVSTLPVNPNPGVPSPSTAPP